MKRTRRLLALMLALAMVLVNLPAQATAVESEELYNPELLVYSFANGEVTVADCDPDAAGRLIIPSEVYGYPVTGILTKAFQNCPGLTSVEIPDTVTAVGTYAFDGCTGLKSVVLSSNLTTIASYTFRGCTSLESIVIPYGVISIGSYAFYGCTGLQSIEIPNGVKTIGSSAFYGCTGLQSVEIAESVTSIGSSAFYGCTGLQSIEIPNGVTSIGNYVFRGCTGLQSIVIPDSVTSIGEDVLSGCSGLESLTAPYAPNVRLGAFFGTSSYSGSTSTYQSGYTYYLPKSLRSVTITRDTMASCTFSNCSMLTEVTLGEKINAGQIKGAFYGCSNLKSLTLPFLGTSNTSSTPLGYLFGTNTFTNALQVTQNSSTYYIPKSLRTVTVTGGEIGYEAFDSCSMLHQVYLGDGVQTIGKYAFYKCSSLLVVAMNESVTNIDDSAFSGCSKLKHVLYGGTLGQWMGITIGTNNTNLTSTKCHYQASGDVIEIVERPYGTCWYCSVCEKDIHDETAMVSKLEFTSVPTKKTYIVNEPLDLTGGQVKITRTDGTTATIAIPADKISGFDNKTVGKKTVTLEINGVTASFDLTVSMATVKFVDKDGTVLSTEDYRYGDTLNVPEVADRPISDAYHEVFSGWNNDFTGICTKSATYTAVYTRTDRVYVVKFVDEDGTVISENSYPYGQTVVVPEAPTKEADETYTYTFAGWDQEVSDTCKAHVVYTAVYKATYIPYTVVFKNWDGTVLEEKECHYGEVPEAPAAERAADETYTYTFTGWDKELICYGAMELTAQYSPVYIEYSVRFVDWDGSVISENNYHYGQSIVIPESPEREKDKTYSYVFAGWDKQVDVCTADVTYTATYTGTYLNDAGGIIAVGNAEVRLGQQVKVPVTVTNNTGLAGIVHTVHFNPALLKLVGVEFQGAFAGGSVILNEEKADEGLVTILWVNHADVTDSGEMYQLVFEPLEINEECVADIEISFDVTGNANLAGENVILGTEKGSVEITTYWLGDLNGDRKYAMVDLVMLAQYVAGFELTFTQKQLLSADVNEDGSIDIHDVVLLNQWLLEEDF